MPTTANVLATAKAVKASLRVRFIFMRASLRVSEDELLRVCLEHHWIAHADWTERSLDGTPLAVARMAGMRGSWRQQGTSSADRRHSAKEQVLP